jgi:uncharacterized membrane protein YhhN
MPSRSALARTVWAAASAVTIAGALTDRPELQRFAKPLIVPALALGVRPPDAAQTALFGTGLAAATVGDVILLQPDDDRRIVCGAGAFAVMQGAYSVLLVRRRARVTAPAAMPRVAGWLAAVALLRVRQTAVAAPLAAYGLALGTATTLASDPALAAESRAVGGFVVPDRDPRSRLALGALLFTLSDGMIVLRRALLTGERARRLTEGVVLATYAGAQLLLVEGMSAR